MGLSDIAAADELSLIQRAAGGDHNAFAALMRRYEPRIHSYLRQMVGDAEQARDLTQETFLAAYRALGRWQPPSATAPGDTDLLSPWLYSIATNRALTLLRRQAALRRIQARTPAAEEEGASVEDAVIGRTLLRAALETLDDESAACLALHYVAGERYGEIAARLKLSNEAVRKRVGRALTALRKAYSAMESEESEAAQ